MSTEEIGDLDGTPVLAVTIEKGPLAARLITYGARLTELWVPDRAGRRADVVLGHATLEGYLTHDAYFGATCGRFSNRIARGRFDLDGSEYQLSQNEGVHHLHGGLRGFDKKTWSIADQSESHVVFSAFSPHGEMGYPGSCELSVEYRLASDDRMRITMSAVSDMRTPINMVHHSYFNLAGYASGPIVDHHLTIPASTYLPVDSELIPTGEQVNVAGTCFDFRNLRQIGSDIRSVRGGRGYDHNWCLDDAADALRMCAVARDPSSGRGLELRTTEPGVQLYTGSYLSDAMCGKGGNRLFPFAGFTLETQKFPNSPNEEDFPNSILSLGEDYVHMMEFRFFAD